jgi:hypothetical protein
MAGQSLMAQDIGKAMLDYEPYVRAGLFFAVFAVMTIWDGGRQQRHWPEAPAPLALRSSLV